MPVNGTVHDSGCGSGAEGANGVTIGLAVSTLNNPYFVQLTDGAREAAAELGVTLVVVDAQNDAINQINQVQTFTTRGMKSIIINPVDLTQARPAAKAAENANIPLISVDARSTAATSPPRSSRTTCRAGGSRPSS